MIKIETRGVERSYMSTNNSQLDIAINYLEESYAFFSESIHSVDRSTRSHRFSNSTIDFDIKRLDGYMIELGHAFFVRLEGAIEAAVHRSEIRGTDLVPYLKESGEWSDFEVAGLESMRSLRNILHHADGDPDSYQRKTPGYVHETGKRPQFFPEHMASWFTLARKIAKHLND